MTYPNGKYFFVKKTSEKSRNLKNRTFYDQRMDNVPITNFVRTLKECVILKNEHQ